MSDIDQIEQSIFQMRGNVEYLRGLNAMDEAPRLKEAYKASIKEQVALMRDKRVLALAVANIGLSALAVTVAAAPQFTTTKVPGWISDVCSQQSADQIIQWTPVIFQRYFHNLAANAQALTPDIVKGLFSNATPRWIAYLQASFPPTPGDVHNNIVNGIDYNKVAQTFSMFIGRAEQITKVVQDVISKLDEADLVELRSKADLLKTEWERYMRERQTSEQKQDEMLTRGDRRRETVENTKNQIR
jgi:hypothetical protein